MSTVHKVATVQFEPIMFEKERNIARLLELCEQAAAAGAKLIVTPEMGTTGYCWFDRAEFGPLSSGFGADHRPVCGAGTQA